MLPPRAAFADAPAATMKDQCADAYEATQRSSASGKLLEARTNAVYCAQSACPALLRSDCSAWADELAARIPSLIIEARSVAGERLSAVRLRLDESAPEALDGRSRELDPGRHVLSFSGPELRSKRVELVMVEGSRAEHFVVTLEPSAGVAAARAAPSPARPSLPTVSYVLAGAGVVALSGFAYFGLSGNAKKSELEACRPGCDSSLRGPLRRDYVLADVSLGVGLVALGVSAWLAIASQSNAPAKAAFDVNVVGESAFLSYRSRF